MKEGTLMERHMTTSRQLQAPLAQVREALDEDPATVISGKSGPIADGYTVDLHVDGSQGSSVHQQVRVRLAPVAGTDDEAAWTINLEPVGHDHLLPRFTGTLEADDRPEGTALRMVGTYRPPLGPVGGFADRLLGRRLARLSLEAFLGEVAERVERHREDRVQMAGVLPAAYPPDLRERDGDRETPENWLG